MESTLPEVARVVHILSQTAEAIPTSVAPPRSWSRDGERACKAVRDGEAEEGKEKVLLLVRCGCD